MYGIKGYGLKDILWQKTIIPLETTTGVMITSIEDLNEWLTSRIEGTEYNAAKKQIRIERVKKSNMRRNKKETFEIIEEEDEQCIVI